MSKDNGGPAFPNESALYTEQRTGMTLRDYFAAKALQGMCADPGTAGTRGVDIVEEAYELADAMLKERKK